MISEAKYDTQEPRNLNDAALDPCAPELPPSRPEIEHTTTLSTIARRRMSIALGAVHDITNSIMPYDHDQVMQVDAVLQRARASIPEIMTWRPIEANITDSPQLTFARLHGRQMYYHGMITLHRKFAFAEPEKTALSSAQTFAYSRTVCIDVALEILRMQCILDEETSEEGQLYSMRWRVSSLMTHQFLTATMILCALLLRSKAVVRHPEMAAALAQAYHIWEQNSSASQEAKKATRAIRYVLDAMKGRPNDAPNTEPFHVTLPMAVEPLDRDGTPFGDLSDLFDISNDAFANQYGLCDYESHAESFPF